ncbi:OprO/OprP family phosphate-selective porin [Craurococcus roseus]|uniref:OprO/OprP family phosphate-selective porin n=1 Tax=Craurococcus roseus TaxID=77585 RepID=A0ABP3R506_9PROT
MGWTERLEFATPDGAFSIGPTGRIHFDGAYVLGPDGDRVGPRGQTSLRRARIGVEGRLFHDFEYAFRWNFAGYPSERTGLSRLSLAYVGLEPFRFIAGAIKPRFTLEDSQSSNNILFLERAAAARAASSLAGGSARYAAGVEAGAERVFGAAYLTGGDANVSGDERQRGAQVRLAGTPLHAGGAVLHIGASLSWVFTPSLSGGRRAVDIDERPELRPGTERLLDTGALPARGARTEGVELGFSQGRFWAQGEYHRILVDRPGGLPRAQFDGWYAQAAYVLTGRPRAWRGSRGAWDRPRPVAGLDPRAGAFGAVEVGLRYSRLDLDHRDVRGGRQGIWTAGANWYPADDLRLTLQYQIGEAVPEGEDRTLRFQAIGLRLQTIF